MANNVRVECWKCGKTEVMVRNDGQLSRHARKRGERNCAAGAEGPEVWPVTDPVPGLAEWMEANGW